MPLVMQFQQGETLDKAPAHLAVPAGFAAGTSCEEILGACTGVGAGWPPLTTATLLLLDTLTGSNPSGLCLLLCPEGRLGTAPDLTISASLRPAAFRQHDEACLRAANCLGQDTATLELVRAGPVASALP